MTEIACDNCRTPLSSDPGPGYSHYFCSSACRFSWSLSHAEPVPWKPFTGKLKAEQPKYREATSDRVKRRPPDDPTPSEVRETYGWLWLSIVLTVTAALGGIFVWARLHPDATVVLGPFTIQQGHAKVGP